ncbi:hypothetical protein [Rhizobium sp. BK176]|uniref:hypothetical protein n=1 Tax=Rhizobium sp. BK176 TaxID=2587071 RepID=UPI002169352E|nr:hypothetical protein [Rhizobium sp. BK176]MCS4089496.1 hypothetical protein [Rhizobium sp. BK176]
MATSLFDHKITRLSAKRDGAAAVGETAIALRLTEQILELIRSEKKLRRPVSLKPRRSRA